MAKKIMEGKGKGNAEQRNDIVAAASIVAYDL